MARTRTTDTVARPASDVYTGLLALSLIALVTSCVILFLDYNQYGEMTPPKPAVAPKSSGGGGAPPATPVTEVPPTIVPVAAVEYPAPVLPAPVAPDAPAVLPGTVDGPSLPRPE